MIPDDLKYTSDHEWLRLEGDAGTVGVTAFAQESLGDVTFVELPEVGSRFGRGEAFGVVESVKAASDLFLPVAGEITAVNDALEQSPELVNSDPYGEGWIVRVKVDDPAEAADLMSPEAYREHIG